MNITVDGIIYQAQSHGGISHLYEEILPRMCEQDHGLHINLLTSGKCKKALPVHPQITHRALIPIDDILRPTRLWGSTRFGIRAYLQNSMRNNYRDQIWHSTYYTVPYKWKGPIVLTVYDMISEHFAVELFNKHIDEVYRKHKRHCIEKADIIICISETTKRDLEEFYRVNSSRIDVIHLAASPVFQQVDNPGNLPESIDSKPFLLFVGGRCHYKNFGLLLRAYGSWPKRSDINLVVVGGTWTPQEREILKELNLTQQVSLLTDIDNEKLCFLYNRASAFVFPSLYEGFGIPLLEAMACGCPVVAAKIPSAVEVAEDCPIYFEPGDQNSLICALDRAITEGRSSERVALGLNRASQFSWDITAHETLNIYRELTTAP